MYWQPGMKLEDLEREAILAAMGFYHQNKTQTAQALGISIRTLDAKLAKYEAIVTAQEEARDQRLAEEEAKLRADGYLKCAP